MQLPAKDTWSQNPEDHNQHLYCHENFKFHAGNLIEEAIATQFD
jgi:hypothetical protein